MKIILLLLFIVSCSGVPVSSNKGKVSKNDTQNPPPKTLLYCIEGAANISNTHPKNYYTVKNLDIPNNHFDLPILYNKEVEKWIKYFISDRGRIWVDKYLLNSVKVSHTFSEILAEKELPRDLIFLAMAESGFQYDIISKSRAVGAWQFMSFTGQRYGLQVDNFYDERRNPRKAAYAAAEYLKDLYSMFNSWELAMAAYNAGEGKIARAISRYKTRNFWKLTKGSYLKPETKNYVPKIMALAIIGKNLEHFGFSALEQSNNLVKVFEVVIPARTDLVKLAEQLELDFDIMRQLNPEYVRWHTPLENKDYILKIPEEKKKSFEKVAFDDLIANEFQISPYKKLEQASKNYKVPMDILKSLNANREKDSLVILPFRNNHTQDDRMYADFKYIKNKRYHGVGTYKVKRGETFWSISRKVGLSVNKIKRLNAHVKILHPGTRLTIK